MRHVAEGASAMELWDGHLPSVSEGLIAGALPPPGVYVIWNQYMSSLNIYNNDAKVTGNKLDTIVEVPVVLWNPGIKVFGATYSASLAFPFDYTNLKVPNYGGTSANGHWGTFNTTIDPILLTWALPNHFYLKTGLSVVLNDASSSPGHPPNGGGVGSGNGYGSLSPIFGISWLHDGWNLSAAGQFFYNFPNKTTQYRSGNELTVDYTVAKTIGPWTIGLGGYSVNQLTSDSGPGAAFCGAKGGCKAVNYGVGPMLGYQFGKVSIFASYNRSVYVRNDVGGNIVNIRIVVPLS